MLLFLNRIRQPVELIDQTAHVIFPHALYHAGDSVIEVYKGFIQSAAPLLRQNDAGIAPVSLVRLAPQQAAFLQMAESTGGGGGGTVHIVGQS